MKLVRRRIGGYIRDQNCEYRCIAVILYINCSVNPSTYSTEQVRRCMNPGQSATHNCCLQTQCGANDGLNIIQVSSVVFPWKPNGAVCKS